MSGRLPYAEEEDEVPGLVGADPPLVASPPAPRTQAPTPEGPEASPPIATASSKPRQTQPAAAPVADAQRRLLVEAVRGGPLGGDEDPMLIAMAAISLLRSIPFAEVEQDGSGAWFIPLSPEAARDLRSFTAAPPRRRA